MLKPTAPARLLLPAVIILLIYGSLYPGHLQLDRATIPQAFQILSNSWTKSLDLSLINDVVLNVLIYLPLGALGWAVLRQQPLSCRIPAPILLGFLLSASMELLQVYVPTRIPSLMDILTNTTGTALGIGLAWLYTDWMKAHWPNFSATVNSEPRAAVLLGLWASAQWVPFIPGIGLNVLRQKLVHVLTIDWDRFPRELLSAASAWIAALLLLETLARGTRKWRFLVPLCVTACRFLIYRQHPAAGDLAGMLLAVGIYHGLLQNSPFRFPFAAGFHLLAILVSGLTPLRFAAVPAPFLWVPFGASLEMGNWEIAGVILLAKAFRYGVALWLLNHFKAALLPAGVTVAIMLGIIEWIQTYLPGHSAEITDPLLCLMLAALLWVLEPPTTRLRFLRLKS